MPNIKSQIKRVKTSEAARARNAAAKSEARTAIKKVENLLAAGKKEDALIAKKEAISILDRLSQKGVYARNTVNRKKAHLEKICA